MKKYLCCFFLVIANVFYIAPTYAEIYKWTDKDGKVHYGDKKVDKKAEDITDSVKKPNIDTSTEEHQKLETVFRKENAADRAYKAQQAMPDPAAENHERRCADANDRLSKLEGRVNFIDENGKVIKTSEQEREARAGEMRKILADNCPAS